MTCGWAGGVTAGAVAEGEGVAVVVGAFESGDEVLTEGSVVVVEFVGLFIGVAFLTVDSVGFALICEVGWVADVGEFETLTIKSTNRTPVAISHFLKTGSFLTAFTIPKTKATTDANKLRTPIATHILKHPRFICQAVFLAV